MNLIGLIFGKCRVSCPVASSTALAEIIRAYDITTDSVKIEGEVSLVTIWESRRKRFEAAADEAGLQYEIARMTGLPRFFARYRRRPGMLLGAVLFLLIVLYSGRVIWDFEVTGNVTVSDREIISALAEVGCAPGAYYPGIDFSMLQNQCLIEEDRLAWISVNMDGNLARVEVREKRRVEMESLQEGGFANIVAAESGVIELCSVRRGETAVAVGDVVKKGELLISGVVSVGETGVRYEHAQGEVLARVYREIKEEVRFKSVKTVPTGEKILQKQLKIFGFSTNLFSKGGIGDGLYGKIEEEKQLSLPFGITLPIRYTVTEYTPLASVEVEYTEAEATRLARIGARAALADMAETLQVLSVEERLLATEEGVTVTLSVYGVTDIAAVYGFSADFETE